MDMGTLVHSHAVVLRMIPSSVMQSLVGDTQKSLFCLLLLIGFHIDDRNMFPRSTTADHRFPLDELTTMRKPVEENKDDGETVDADSNEDDGDAGEEEEDGDDGSDYEGKDSADDAEANGDSDSDDDDDDGEEDDDDGDDDNEEEEEEDVDDEEELKGPPSKRKK